MLFVNYSLSLVPSFSCSCLSSPVFYFSDGLISGAASPQLQHSFCMLVLIFLVLMGLCIYNRPFQRLKKGICIAGQLSRSGWLTRRGVKARPSGSSRVLNWVGVPHCDPTKFSNAAAQERVPMAFFSSLSRYALKEGLGQPSSHGRVVLLNSPVPLWAWGLESPFPKRL